MSKTITLASLERFYIGLLEEQGFMNLNDYFYKRPPQTDYLYNKLNEFELYESNKIRITWGKYEVNIIPPKYIHEIDEYFDNINLFEITL